MPVDRRSWRRRLTAPAVLLPLIAAAVILIWQDYHARRDYLIATLELRSAEVTTQLEALVNATDAGVRAIAVSFPIAELTAADQRAAGTTVVPDLRLRQALDAYPGMYERVAIVDATGMLLASSRPFTAGDRLTGAERAVRSSTTNGLAVSNVLAPATGDPPTVLFSHPLPAVAGGPPSRSVIFVATIAAVGGVLDIAPDLPLSARYRVFDGVGRVVASSHDAPGASAGDDVSDRAVWAEASMHRTTPWFGRGLSGDARIIFFAYPSQTPWITTVSYARSDLFAPLWRRLTLLSAGLALSVIGTLVLAELADRRERRAWARLAAEQHVRDRQELAREAQHHVRNALQVLRLRQAAETDPQIQAYVDEAMARIEWVLRDVLPAGMAGNLRPPDPPEPRDVGPGEGPADGPARG